MLSNEKFFNETSSFYDEMINYEKAIERKQKLLKEFITDEMKFAADIGCGTGVDSIVLSNLGLKVTAFDISEKMIDIAKQNSDKFSANVKFVKSSASEIPEQFENKFDLVVSLGNTFANISNKDIKNAFSRIFKLLKDNGSAIIQILNFSKVLKENKRIVNITENNNQIFIRFYDFHTSHINFNILRFDKEDLGKRKLITTKLFPHQKKELEFVVKELGFKDYQFYSNLNCDEFNEDKSKDLVIKLEK